METNPGLSPIHVGGIATTSPADVITIATRVADELARVIRGRGLSVNIRGRDYVRYEGWSMLGAMLGLAAREVKVRRLDDGSFEAQVEIIRLSDGAVIGRASALCGADEPEWAKRPEYARRSMSITRAAAKAFRLLLGWVMPLAGYEPTPAEEATVINGATLERPAHAARTARTQITAPPSQSAQHQSPGEWTAFWKAARAAGLTPAAVAERLGKPLKDWLAEGGHTLDDALRALGLSENA